MSISSLCDVLNDLAGGRVVALARNLTPRTPLTEFDVFLEHDDVLASLNRQYRYARQQHQAARVEYGADAPLCDIAADMEDSAWCAMQTRLMELRSDGDLMRFVQKAVWEAECEEQRAQQAYQDKKALDFFNRMEAARLMKDNNKSSHIYEWLMVLMLYHRFLRLPFPGAAMPERMAA